MDVKKLSIDVDNFYRDNKSEFAGFEKEYVYHYNQSFEAEASTREAAVA